jgi:hypothetical protein
MLLTHLSKSQLVWLFNSPVLDGHDFRSLGGLRALVCIAQSYRFAKTHSPTAKWFPSLRYTRGGSGAAVGHSQWFLADLLPSHLGLARLGTVGAKTHSTDPKLSAVKAVAATLARQHGVEDCFSAITLYLATWNLYVYQVFVIVYAETRKKDSATVAPHFHDFASDFERLTLTRLLDSDQLQLRTSPREADMALLRLCYILLVDLPTQSFRFCRSCYQ